MMEHTNLAARTDIVLGIFIVNEVSSVIVKKTIKIRESWIPLTAKRAYVASKISRGLSSRARLDFLWNAL